MFCTFAGMASLTLDSRLYDDDDDDGDLFCGMVD